MPPPTRADLREATYWLFISAITNHVMTCPTASFPEEHPVCREKCCPTCCGTCSTLRWFRDEADGYLTRMLNQFEPGSTWSWQMWDGSMDWPQIEAHWDDTGAACHSHLCLEASATHAGVALASQGDPAP